MRLEPVRVDLGEVEAIRPSWHCFLRFRERRFHRGEGGSEEAAEALAATLRNAELTARVPPGVGGLSEPYALWAVSGGLAFPLVEGERGEWTATTCLAVRPRGSSGR